MSLFQPSYRVHPSFPKLIHFGLVYSPFIFHYMPTPSCLCLSPGFYSVSGSSLSDSCYSVSSEAAQGGLGRLAPLSGGSSRLWEQRPLSADHSDTQWPEAAAQKQPTAHSTEETSGVADRRPVSTGLNDKHTNLYIYIYIYIHTNTYCIILYGFIGKL